MPATTTTAWRVLLVDDDQLVADSICRMLEFDQHRVTAAASGAHALQLCDKENFDVVILDFIMPEMRGDKLALALKERFPERPIIMITGDAEKMENVHRPPVGVDFLMGKPFRLDHLREALKTVLVKA